MTRRAAPPFLQGCGPSTALPDRLLADQVAQHVLHDAAVAVVVRFTGGVAADDRVELDADPRSCTDADSICRIFTRPEPTDSVAVR